MRGGQHGRRSAAAWLALLCVWLVSSGCCAPRCNLPADDVPRELDKVSLETYILEPPDIILIDAIRLIPKPPYRVEPLDQLFINLSNPLTEAVAGLYSVEPDGTVNL